MGCQSDFKEPSYCCPIELLAVAKCTLGVQGQLCSDNYAASGDIIVATSGITGMLERWPCNFMWDIQ